MIQLTLDFYKRNYIEGLFLSSGISRNADFTMERMVRVAKTLRIEHGFRGYIHLKSIPEASPELIEQAGLYADRLSVNVELPTQQGLEELVPEKNLRRIQGSMANIRDKRDESIERLRSAKSEQAKNQVARERAFAPAGQSTQMIVGADGADDRAILSRADLLYNAYQLRRVYYSQPTVRYRMHPSCCRPSSRPLLGRIDYTRLTGYCVSMGLSWTKSCPNRQAI